MQISTLLNTGKWVTLFRKYTNNLENSVDLNVSVYCIEPRVPQPTGTWQPPIPSPPHIHQSQYIFALSFSSFTTKEAYVMTVHHSFLIWIYCNKLEHNAFLADMQCNTVYLHARKNVILRVSVLSFSCGAPTPLSTAQGTFLLSLSVNTKFHSSL